MSCPLDTSFGPWAGIDCRGGLDFTFLFELIFFSMIPAAAFIIAVLWDNQFPSQQQIPELRKLGYLRVCKLVSEVVVCGLLMTIIDLL